MVFSLVLVKKGTIFSVIIMRRLKWVLVSRHEHGWEMVLHTVLGGGEGK